MKKITYVIMVAALMFAAVCMTSCGGNVTPEVPDKPDEIIEMGHYSLHFETLALSNWPDPKESILKDYEAYKKTVTDALKIDTDKKYKWSEIEAEKDRLQKAFDDLPGFDFKVKSALNIFTYSGITFKAYKEGQSAAAIDFGKKDITCIKDIPEGTTSQLYFVMESFEAAAPSTKDYCEKVRTLFADAFKDVFADDFDLVVTDGTVEKHTYYNLANYPGDRDKVVANMKAICEDVEVPVLSDEIKQKALEEYPKMNNLLTIVFNSYDPFVYAPTKSEKEIFSLTISVK